MKFGYAWTFVNKSRGKTPAQSRHRESEPRPYRAAGSPLKLGCLTPTGLFSACWRASKIGSDILNGELGPKPGEWRIAPPGGAMPSILGEAAEPCAG
jgi:hypothetical protein